jgi:hypothetical protein
LVTGADLRDRAVVRVAEAAGEVVGKITVEETDVRCIEQAIADMRAACELTRSSYTPGRSRTPSSGL